MSEAPAAVVPLTNGLQFFGSEQEALPGAAGAILKNAPATLLPTAQKFRVFAAHATATIGSSMLYGGDRKDIAAEAEAAPLPPDLVFVSCYPELFALTAPREEPQARVLAYLRAVRGGVLLDTIADRVGLDPEVAENEVNALEAAGAVEKRGGLFYIDLSWRFILPEVVTVDVVEEDDVAGAAVEAALRRAVRHRHFAHKSYIALPSEVATRVADWDVLKHEGVGLLATDDSAVTPSDSDDASGNGLRIILDTVRRSPVLWSPYYHLALAAVARSAANS